MSELTSELNGGLQMAEELLLHVVVNTSFNDATAGVNHEQSEPEHMLQIRMLVMCNTWCNEPPPEQHSGVFLIQWSHFKG